MKGLKYSKKIREEVTSFSQLIETYCTKINKEYLKNQIKMLEMIAFDYELDINILIEKYIKNKSITEEDDEEDEDESSVLTSESTTSKNNISKTSIINTLLDKIIFNEKSYYIDKNNTVFDKDKKTVGKYVDSKILFT